MPSLTYTFVSRCAGEAIAYLAASQDRQTQATLAPKRVIRDASGSPVGIETVAA